MKFTTRSADFLRDHVNLNATRLQELDDHVQAIRNYLEGHQVFGDILTDVIPQGSWAHRTIIKPKPDKEFDADILIEVIEPTGWGASDYVENLWSALRDSEVYKPKASRKDRCVRVQYAGECHVDVVPFLRTPTGGMITNRVTGEFEATDPEGFTAWFQHKNGLAGGDLKRVIRLVKFLRDRKGTFSIKSVILTTLLAERVSEGALAAEPDCYADVPTTLKTLMNALADHLEAHEDPPTVADPSMPGSTFDHRWDEATYPNLRTKVRHYADKIAAAHEEEDPDNSMALWREVFGADFGYDPVTKAAAKADVASRAPDEQFLDEDYGVQMPPQRPHTVDVSCRVEGKQGFREGDLARLRHRVRKGRRLTFTATTNVPEPYEMYWKVRNTGDEATRSRDLRGRIEPDGGFRRWTERTLYAGSHYVECYVVKDQVCVASARYPVRII